MVFTGRPGDRVLSRGESPVHMFFECRCLALLCRSCNAVDNCGWRARPFGSYRRIIWGGWAQTTAEEI